MWRYVIRPSLLAIKKVSRPKNLPRDENAPSKTEIKQQMESLQDLGEVLTQLSRDQLKQLDLPEILVDAIDELSRVGKHEATRRHMQYIGKLMRNIDPEPIRAQIDRWESGTRANVAAFKSAERWRDRMLTEQGALGEFVVTQPDVDRAALAVLIEKARLEVARGKPPAAARQIFRVVHKLLLKVPMVGSTATTDE
jgi:ribosome-associated protein